MGKRQGLCLSAEDSDRTTPRPICVVEKLRAEGRPYPYKMSGPARFLVAGSWFGKQGGESVAELRVFAS